MVTPKMLGHIRPEFIFNYSSKPGYVLPKLSNYLTIHNGYMYEFFTGAEKMVAVYKVYTDDDDYIIDFELVNIVYLDNRIDVYRWIMVGDYAVALYNYVSATTSGPTSSTTSGGTTIYSSSASASAYLRLAAYKLDGTNVIETYHDCGLLCNASASINGSSSGITPSSNISGNMMIDDDGEVRIALNAYAKVSQESYDGCIVHFNLNTLIEGIEAGADLSSIILTELGTGRCYMLGFNDYVMYSKQTLDGSTSSRNGFWKYSILEDNSCNIDTSATTTAPSNSDIPPIFVMGGYKFGIIDHVCGSFIYTNAHSTARNVSWNIIYNDRSTLHGYIQHIEGIISTNDQIPHMNALNGYFINYPDGIHNILNTISGSNIGSVTSTIATKVTDVGNKVIYATKLDITNNNMNYHLERIKLPWMYIPNGHIINYSNRWYSIGGDTDGTPTSINRACTSNLYGRVLFTIIEHDESTDTFYNVIKGHTPAATATDSIVEITRIDYILYNDDLTSSQPTLFLFIADNHGRLYPIAWKAFLRGSSSYSSADTYLVPTGTLDYSNNPIILNPGNSLYILTAMPELPEGLGTHPEFTLYGCELTNS